VGPRAGLEVMKKRDISLPVQDLKRGRPAVARRYALYRTHYNDRSPYSGEEPQDEKRFSKQ
jgi:hypothetical protein